MHSWNHMKRLTSIAKVSDYVHVHLLQSYAYIKVLIEYINTFVWILHVSRLYILSPVNQQWAHELAIQRACFYR